MKKLCSKNGLFSFYLNENGKYQYKLNSDEILNFENENRISEGLFELFIYKTYEEIENENAKQTSILPTSWFIMYNVLQNINSYQINEDKYIDNNNDGNISNNSSTYFVPTFNDNENICELYIFDKYQSNENDKNQRIFIFSSSSAKEEDIESRYLFFLEKLQKITKNLNKTEKTSIEIIRYPQKITFFETQLLCLKICVNGVKSKNCNEYLGSLPKLKIDNECITEIKNTLIPGFHHKAMSYYDERLNSYVTPVKDGANPIKEVQISYKNNKHKSLSPVYTRKTNILANTPKGNQGLVWNENKKKNKTKNKTEDTERNTAAPSSSRVDNIEPYKRKIVKGDYNTENTSMNGITLTNELKEIKIPISNNETSRTSKQKMKIRKRSDDVINLNINNNNNNINYNYNINNGNNQTTSKHNNPRHNEIDSSLFNLTEGEDVDEILKRNHWESRRKEKRSFIQKIDYDKIEENLNKDNNKSLKDSQVFPCETCGTGNCIIF